MLYNQRITCVWVDMTPESKYDKWSSIINEQVSARDFQYLCCDILRRKQFISPIVRGRGGDGGRDIETSYVQELPTGDSQIEDYWVSCKRQKSDVAWADLAEDVSRADNATIERFLIMSNMGLSNNCLDEVEKWNKNKRTRIIDWAGKSFLDTLWQLPDVCEKYLPSEKPPAIFSKEQPKEMLEYSRQEGRKLGVELAIPTGTEEEIKSMEQAVRRVLKIINETIIENEKVRSRLYETFSLLFLNLGNPVEALDLIDRALSIDPESETALINKAVILSVSYRWEESDEIYERLLLKNPENTYAITNKAANALSQGHIDEALGLAERILTAQPESMPGIRIKSRALVADGRPEDALIFLDEMEKRVGGNNAIIKEKATVLIEMIDLKKAMTEIEKVLKTAPTDLEAINIRGGIYSKNAGYQNQKRYLELALQDTEIVRQSSQRNSVAWSNQSLLLMKLDRSVEARKLLDKSREICPEYAQYWGIRGVLEMEAGKYNTALKFFDKQLSMQFDPEILTGKMAVMLERNDHNGIILFSNQFTEMVNTPDFWDIRGKALKKIHRIHEADKCFMKSKRMHREPISLLE